MVDRLTVESERRLPTDRGPHRRLLPGTEFRTRAAALICRLLRQVRHYAAVEWQGWLRVAVANGDWKMTCLAGSDRIRSRERNLR